MRVDSLLPPYVHQHQHAPMEINLLAHPTIKVAAKRLATVLISSKAMWVDGCGTSAQLIKADCSRQNMKIY